LLKQFWLKFPSHPNHPRECGFKCIVRHRCEFEGPYSVMGVNHCETCDEAFRVFVCLWGQMQLLRLCALLCRNQLTLLEWLSATGPRGSAMLLSCTMCVTVPDEATLVAAVTSSMASSWVSLPDEVDSGGAYELLVHVNLLAGLAWSLLTGRHACEGWLAWALLFVASWP